MTWLELSVTERDDIVRTTIAQGEQAHQDGGELTHCPYPTHTQQSTWWKRGFMNARLGSNIANNR